MHLEKEYFSVTEDKRDQESWKVANVNNTIVINPGNGLYIKVAHANKNLTVSISDTPKNEFAAEHVDSVLCEECVDITTLFIDTLDNNKAFINPQGKIQVHIHRTEEGMIADIWDMSTPDEEEVIASVGVVFSDFDLE